MKSIGVLICALYAVSVWGGADPVLNEAPTSFQLICPRNVVVDCDEDLRDLSKWGDAYVLKDYKRISAGTPTVVDERNSCGVGVVTRTWRVEDPYRKWHTCTQIIEVKGGGAFGYQDITWPEDWTIDTCNLNIHPGNLPDRYGYPRFNNKHCAMPAYSYRDEVFNFSPTCRKIIRYWKVLDWCTYKPGGNSGIWERPQVIKIEKGGKTPIITCPADTSIMTDNCDSAEVILEDIIAISSCGDTLKVTNNSPYADNKHGNASGTYPIGRHTFKYYVEYGCAQELKCEVTINIVSNKPPTPYCKNGIITTLMPIDTNNDGTIDDGMREVWASDLNAGSFHACDPHRKLTYSFSMDTTDKVINFTCENLGKNEVEIWVTDEFGNQSYCITYIMVQNNNPNLTDCEPDSLRGGTITGSAALSSGMAIHQVDVQVKGYDAAFTVATFHDTIILPNGQVQIITNTDTTWEDLDLIQLASNGDYRFRKLPMGKDYDIMVERSGDLMNGVDIWDYYLLFYSFYGWTSLDDPLQRIAADVNTDGKVNQLDAQLLIKSILNPDPQNPDFKSWCFFEKERLNEWVQAGGTGSMLEEAYQILPMQTKNMEIMWTGVKIGDLDATVDPAGLRGPNRDVALRSILHGTVASSDEIPNTFQFQLNPSLVLADMEIPVPLNDIVEVQGEGDFHLVESQFGTRVIWMQPDGGNGTMTITFASTEVSKGLIENIESLAYDASGQLYNLSWISENSNAGASMKIYNIFPNPARSWISIEWNNTSLKDTRVQIFNHLGQQVQENYIGSFDMGLSHSVIDIDPMHSSGPYFIRITQDGEYCTGSFVKF